MEVKATPRPFYPRPRDLVLTVRHLLERTHVEVRYCTLQSAREHEADTERTNSHSRY